jgi:hypothetical protein
MKLIIALTCGIRDGWQQYQDFTSGITFPSRLLSEAYDRGVNIGIAAHKLLTASE